MGYIEDEQTHNLSKSISVINTRKMHTHAPSHSSEHADINPVRQAKLTGLFSHLNPNYNSHTGAPENLFPKTEQARGKPAEGDWDKTLSPSGDEL